MVEAQTLDEQWILVLGGEKGGPGKSCLAQNLSVAIKLLGGDVLLVDADPQATSYEWANIRDRNGALVSIPHEKAHGDISTTLKDRAKRYSHIIVDCGGADSEALRVAADAELTLLPTWHCPISIKSKVRPANALRSISLGQRNFGSRVNSASAATEQGHLALILVGTQIRHECI
ncbi:division plane positioning ATPase MipZ [Pseudomonas amygdali]